MSEAPRPAPAVPRHRWLRRAVAALLGALAAALVAAYVLRNALVGPVVVGKASAWLEREHGLALSVDEFDGNWISSLTLRGVAVSTAPGATRPWSALARSVELEYSLWAALRGEPAWLARVRVSELDARADLAGPGEPGPAGGEVGPGLGALPALPEVEIGRLDLDLALPGTRGVLVRSARLAHSGGAFTFGMPRLSLEGDWPLLPREFSLEARLHRDADALALDSLELHGGLDAVATGGRVELGHGRARVELALELDGGALGCTATGAGDSWQFDWNAQSLDLALAARLAERALDLGAEGFLDASGTTIVERGEAWSTASVTVRELCVLGRQLDLVEGQLELQPGRFGAGELFVRQRENLLWARGLSLPLDAPDLLGLLRRARGELELAIHDVGELHAGSGAVLPAHRLTVSGALDERGVELLRGRLDTSSGRLVVRRGRVEWGEPLDERTSLDLDLDVLFRDLGELGPLIDTRPWAGSLMGTLHVSGDVADPSGLLVARGEDVVISGKALGATVVRARGQGRRIEVDSLRASGPLGELDIVGAVDLGTRSIERAHLRLSTPRLDILLPGTFERGALSVDATVSGPLEALEGEYELSAFDLALAEGTEIDSLHSSGRLEPTRLVARTLEASARGLDLAARATLVHEAWSAPFLLELESLVLAREGLALVLDAPAAVELAPGRVLAPSFAFSGLRGRLQAGIAYDRGTLEFSGRFEDIDPMPLAAPFLPEGVSLGAVDGRLSLLRKDGLHELICDLRVDRLALQPDLPEVSLGFVGRAAGERASVESLTLRSADGLALELAGELPFDATEPWRWREGTLQLRSTASVPDARVIPWRRLGLLAPLEGRLGARLVLAGRPPDLRGSLELEGRALALSPEPSAGVLSTLRLSDGELDARLVLDGGLAVERATLTANPAFRASAEGALLGREGVRALFSEPARALEEPGADLHARWEIADVGVLQPLVPLVRRVRGASSGEVSLRGALARPELSGSVAWSEGEVRLEVGLPAIDALAGRARLEGRIVRIESLSGELGAGPFTLAGSVDLGGEEPSFDLRLDGRELLLVQRRDLRLRADGHLELTGPLSRLSLSGELSTQDSRWSHNFDWFAPRPRARVSREAQPPLFSIKSGPLADLRFDLRLRGGDPFRVSSNVLKGSLRPDLALTGTGRAPVLSGALFLDPTQVLLPAANLELRSGTLGIDRRDPLDLVLDATLSARVRGYDVSVRVTGRASQPELDLSSVPPLSSEDILLLLLTGRVPGGSLSSEEGQEAAETVFVFLGKDLLTRMFAGEDGGATAMLERIELQAGADVTQNGGSTAQVRVRLSGAAQGEGRAIYLRGERDIYDRINYGLRFVLRLR